MKKEEVEIFSDASNMAIMRHPGRVFPGILIQGDTLSSLVSRLAAVLEEKDCLSENGADKLESVHEQLSHFLNHYSSTLKKQGIELPFHQ